MKKNNKQQKGQALVLIALAIVGLFGITGLAIDGGNIYSERRRAQNAADTAALSAALAKVEGGNYDSVARDFISENMAGGSEVSAIVVSTPPVVDCNGNINGPYLDEFGRSVDHDGISISHQYIQVRFHITVKSYFAQLIGWDISDVCVEAIAKAKDYYHGPLFNGNAVIGLDPNGVSYLSQSQSQYWIIHGGGVFANNTALDKHGKVEFPDGDCVTSVGDAIGFVGCTPLTYQYDQLYIYPDEIYAMLPQYDKTQCDQDFCPPPCDVTAEYNPDDGLIHPNSSLSSTDIWKIGSRVATFENQYAPGLYCIEDAGGVINTEVTGTGVTFYFLDHDFTMKYAGGGSLNITAPTSDASGGFRNVLMFSDITDEPCTQNLELRGNGSSPIIGTVFLPSACINYLGNSEAFSDYVQLIGYQVYSNGTADLNIQFNPDDQQDGSYTGIVELNK